VERAGGKWLECAKRGLGWGRARSPCPPLCGRLGTDWALRTTYSLLPLQCCVFWTERGVQSEVHGRSEHLSHLPVICA
jgi:hypothetical protein